LRQGSPRIDYKDEDCNWSEFVHGVTADYDDWGEFFDVEYMTHPQRRVSERLTNSNIEHFGIIDTTTAGFIDDAMVNEEWVYGATNIYYEKRDYSYQNKVLEKGTVRTWFVVEGKKSYSTGDAITGLYVAGSLASIASLIALFLK
jgi:hypothetical protein